MAGGKSSAGPFSSYRVTGNGVTPSLEDEPRRSDWDPWLESPSCHFLPGSRHDPQPWLTRRQDATSSKPWKSSSSVPEVSADYCWIIVLCLVKSISETLRIWRFSVVSRAHIHCLLSLALKQAVCWGLGVDFTGGDLKVDTWSRQDAAVSSMLFLWKQLDLTHGLYNPPASHIILQNWLSGIPHLYLKLCQCMYVCTTAWGFVILSEQFSLSDFGLPVTFRMPRCYKCVTITRLNTCGDGFRRCGWKCRGSAAWQSLGLASRGTAVWGCVLLYGVVLWFVNRLDYTLFAIRTLSRLKLWCCTCM